jgi:thioester reductase-like protein
MSGERAVDPLVEARSLAEVVRWWAQQRGEALAFRFLVSGIETSTCLSYAELDTRARAIAGWLREHTDEGDRALLIHEPGLSFIVDFIACQYAGVIPVPVQPPSAVSLELGLSRVGGIVRSAMPRVVLASLGLRDRLANELAADLPWLDRGIALADPGAMSLPSAKVPALLQYTSGSTAAPRGVVVEQRNLLANLRAIRSTFGHERSCDGVSWLPAFHDMGLIGMLLQPLYIGGSATTMAPLSFLKRPTLWLEAVSHFGQNTWITSGGPNFGYELCLERVSEAEIDALDLSRWRVAFCGSEPIRHEVLSAFADKFARCGFDKAALFPCYGLAESTLMVSGARLQPSDRALAVRREALARGRAEQAAPGTIGSAWITNCGPTIAEHELRIVDPEHLVEREPGALGEIWVRGPSVAAGYWNDVEASRERFGAHTRAGEGPFLRTGDLGFVHDGHLHVTGRLKELLIIRGRNLFPQDIEATVVACHPELRRACVAAVGLGEHEHELGLIVELPRRAHARRSEIQVAIVQAVTGAHGVAIARLEFVPPRSLPHTSSGKLQRRLACARTFDTPAVRESEPAMQALYDQPDDYFAKLEGRTTNYRFDLERDVAWSRLSEPGLYFTQAVLGPGGVDLDALARIEGVGEVFQWALAIAICEEFVALEQRILRFLRTEQAAGRLPVARSTELFDDEEVKHVQLFRRYADALKAQRPALAAELDAHLLRSFATAWWHDDAPENYPSAAVHHFVHWLHFVYFEEYSIHLHAVLRHDALVQPAWLSAHAAHMREERQHVLTDAAYLQRLILDEPTRREWSKWFLQQSSKDASGLAGLEGVWTFVREQFPAVDSLGSPQSLLGELGLRQRAFVRLLTREGAFGRTLAAAIGFDEFVAELATLPSEAAVSIDVDEPATELELELRERLQAQIALALNMPLERVSLDQALIHFGLDSVAAVQVIADVERHVGVELPPTLLFEQPDVRSLARAIAALAAGRVTAAPTPSAPTLPMLALDDAIFASRARGAQRILLTGATGFLCSHLLEALLDGSEDRVTCLVRADDQAHARARLRATLIENRLDPELADRIEVVVGDIGRPLLGLPSDQFAELAASLDVIYHGAALVDFVRPYAQLEAANVIGTQEIIRLAAAGSRGPTPLNLISTIGIFDTNTQRGDHLIREHDVPEHEAGFRNGYGHSKWAGEQLAIQARRRGLPLRIFRPGVVCGSTRTGAWQPDMVAALLKSFVESGTAIRPVADGSLDAAPADYVAQAIVHIARRADTLGEIFHLNNPAPTPWRTIYRALAQLGHALELVDYGSWLASLTGPTADPALLPYAAYFKTRDQAWKLRQSSFDTSNTRAALLGSDIRCPVVDAKLLALYLEHFRMTGFLRASATHQQAELAHVG